GLRIGVIRDPYWSDSAPGVRQACESALDSLRAGVGGELIEVELPDRELIVPAAVLIAQSEEAAHLTPANLNSLPEELSVLNRGLLKFRSLRPVRRRAGACLARSRGRRTLPELFESLARPACPPAPAAAPPLAEPMIELPSGMTSADAGNGPHCVMANLTGVPGVSLPVG